MRHQPIPAYVLVNVVAGMVTYLGTWPGPCVTGPFAKPVAGVVKFFLSRLS
jgi:hypothetical protein